MSRRRPPFPLPYFPLLPPLNSLPRLFSPLPGNVPGSPLLPWSPVQGSAPPVLARPRALTAVPAALSSGSSHPVAPPATKSFVTGLCFLCTSRSSARPARLEIEQLRSFSRALTKAQRPFQPPSPPTGPQPMVSHSCAPFHYWPKCSFGLCIFSLLRI